MDEKVYHKNFEIEDSYWWFVARNRILSRIIRKYCALPPHSVVLDIGCGTGSFARCLSGDYEVLCLDTSPLALHYCQLRGLDRLYNCDIHEFDASGMTINAATMLDVLEHIEDDSSAVARIRQIIAPGGYFIATVPAYKWLWSGHDVMHRHCRRYTSRSFVKLLEREGFRIKYHTYFDTFLFPLALVKRIMDKFLNTSAEKLEPVDPLPGFINKWFTKIFSFEGKFIPHIRFPFGLSILIVAVKDE